MLIVNRFIVIYFTWFVHDLVNNVRNFDWLTRITHILDGGVYIERINEYLIFSLIYTN